MGEIFIAKAYLKVSHHTTRFDGSDGRKERMQFTFVHVLWQVIDDEICCCIVSVASRVG